MPVRDIITIGASAGGVETLRTVVERLPPSLSAAVFAVVHVHPGSNSMLPQVLARRAQVPVSHAKDGETVRRGHVYIAPPDHHMLVKDGHVHLSRGPRENGVRPAVDVLFRSAAVCCGPRVVGVVLTGMLNDGTAGLMAIKQCGGLAVVQDPADALFPQMPQSALEHVEVDHSVPAADIGLLLGRVAGQPANDAAPAPDSLAIETRIAEGESINVAATGLAVPSTYSCPDCGGVLNEMLLATPLTRFRCRVGHSHTLASLVSTKTAALEEALWTAVRTLRERVELYQRMADQARERGHLQTAQVWSDKSMAAHGHAETIYGVLLGASDVSVDIEIDPKLLQGQ